MQQAAFQLRARFFQLVQHIQRSLVLIGRAHLQVDNHPQQVLRLRLRRLNALDGIANHVERWTQIGRSLVFLKRQIPLRLQGLQLLHRRLGGIGPIQQLPPRGRAFGGKCVPVGLLLAQLQSAGRSSESTFRLPFASVARSRRVRRASLYGIKLLVRGQLAAYVAQQSHQLFRARRHLGQWDGGWPGVGGAAGAAPEGRVGSRLTALVEQRPQRIALGCQGRATQSATSTSREVRSPSVHRRAHGVCASAAGWAHRWKLQKHASAHYRLSRILTL